VSTLAGFRLCLKKISSNYYNYYNSNTSSEGQYNQNNPKPDYKKKYPNNHKFVKKEKAKGAATLDTDSESDYEADKSDYNLDIESDTDAETIPHPIDDEIELRAKFR
jgi:hypothetical protein